MVFYKSALHTKKPPLKCRPAAFSILRENAQEYAILAWVQNINYKIQNQKDIFHFFPTHSIFQATSSAI